MTKQIVSDKLLSKIRKLNLRIMPDTATVYSPTSTSDGRGGWTTTWTAGSSYSCRFRPASQHDRHDRQQLAGGQAISDPMFVAVLPYNAELSEDARLQIDEIDYEIVGWLGNQTYKVGTRVALREVEGETIREN